MTTTTEIAAVVDVLRTNDRFLVTSHENPDGDALGSLLAMHLALVELGKDSVMVLAGESPLPEEYGFLDVAGAGLLREIPEDRLDRVLVAVDCAQETRLTDARLLEAPIVVNIDHHHDNSRFGAVESRRRRCIVDGRGARRRLRRARAVADAGDRRGALHGPRHRYRAVPVLEHDAEGTSTRGRARRGGREPAARLSGGLRVDALPEAQASCSRTRASVAPCRRARRDLVPPARRLR